MTREQITCDGCGRAKGDANHWHKIGVGQSTSSRPWIELGALVGDQWLEDYEVHDLCGQECLHKHLDKLLGFTAGVDPENGTASEGNTSAEAKT